MFIGIYELIEQELYLPNVVLFPYLKKEITACQRKPISAYFRTTFRV